MAKLTDVQNAQNALQSAGTAQTAAQSALAQASDDNARSQAQVKLEEATLAVQSAKDALAAAQNEEDETNAPAADLLKGAFSETVPGGRYKVAGRLVDADGAPIRES